MTKRLTFVPALRAIFSCDNTLSDRDPILVAQFLKGQQQITIKQNKRATAKVAREAPVSNDNPKIAKSARPENTKAAAKEDVDTECEKSETDNEEEDYMEVSSKNFAKQNNDKDLGYVNV